MHRGCQIISSALCAFRQKLRLKGKQEHQGTTDTLLTEQAGDTVVCKRLKLGVNSFIFVASVTMCIAKGGGLSGS